MFIPKALGKESIADKGAESAQLAGQPSETATVEVTRTSGTEGGLIVSTTNFEEPGDTVERREIWRHRVSGPNGQTHARLMGDSNWLDRTGVSASELMHVVALGVIKPSDFKLQGGWKTSSAAREDIKLSVDLINVVREMFDVRNHEHRKTRLARNTPVKMPPVVDDSKPETHFSVSMPPEEAAPVTVDREYPNQLLFEDSVVAVEFAKPAIQPEQLESDGPLARKVESQDCEIEHLRDQVNRLSERMVVNINNSASMGDLDLVVADMEGLAEEVDKMDARLKETVLESYKQYKFLKRMIDQFRKEFRKEFEDFTTPRPAPTEGAASD